MEEPREGAKDGGAGGAGGFKSRVSPSYSRDKVYKTFAVVNGDGSTPQTEETNPGTAARPSGSLHVH